MLVLIEFKRNEISQLCSMICAKCSQRISVLLSCASCYLTSKVPGCSVSVAVYAAVELMSL